MFTPFIWFLFLTRRVCTGPTINHWPVVNFFFDGTTREHYIPLSFIYQFLNQLLLLMVALLYHSVSVINQLIIIIFLLCHWSHLRAPPVSRFASSGCPFSSRLCLIADYRLPIADNFMNRMQENMSDKILENLLILCWCVDFFDFALYEPNSWPNIIIVISN